MDHVDDVAIAMDEGLQKLVDPSKTDTRAARVLMVITDKELGTEVKGLYLSLFSFFCGLVCSETAKCFL